jgi:putative FmdB family regulatory protein
MPIYEYVCDRCHAKFERLVRAFDEAVECPVCAGRSVEKQLSSFAFAGSGASSLAPLRGGCGCGRGGCGCQ